MNNKLLFAGSFNPYTIGHHSVRTNAESMLLETEVHVGITQNPNKPGMNGEQLKWVTNAAFPGFESEKVKVIPHELVAEYAINNGYDGLVRSLRNSIDLVQEVDLATWNKSLGIPTMFIPSDRGLDHISSSAIREIASFGKDMSQYFINDMHYKRWVNGKPKRIIVTGQMGAGKSSFIDEIDCGHVSIDMDARVKDKMKEGTAEKFRSFFNDTMTKDIRRQWDQPHMFDVKSEVEQIIFDELQFRYNEIVEISAFTSYNLDKLYEDSVIVYVNKFENGKKREIDSDLQRKALQLQTPPKYVDFVVNQDNAQDVITAMFKVLKG